MTPGDRSFLGAVIDAGLVQSPCLELGAGIPEHSARELIRARGIEYRGTDLEGAVDYRVDFEAEGVASRVGERFASVLVMNVLEHCFDPIRVLDNACSLLSAGGTCVIVTPAVWPIHAFPIDCWRILPDFYREYARRRGMSVEEGWLRYVDRPDRDMSQLPLPGRSDFHRLYSRVAHKLFDTTGRGTWTRTHVAVGAVLRKAAPAPTAP